jgi:membrane protein DedA with SNARE-associated domain
VAIIFWFGLLVYMGICGWQLSEILGTKDATGMWWWMVYLLTPIILLMIGMTLCAFYRDKKIKEIKAEY